MVGIHAWGRKRGKLSTFCSELRSTVELSFGWSSKKMSLDQARLPQKITTTNNKSYTDNKCLEELGYTKRKMFNLRVLISSKCAIFNFKMIIINSKVV